MQLCGNCGEYNSDDNIFCNRCGNQLNNKCPDCGFPNLPQQKFCGSCGKQLSVDASLGPAAMQYGQGQQPTQPAPAKPAPAAVMQAPAPAIAPPPPSPVMPPSVPAVPQSEASVEVVSEQFGEDDSVHFETYRGLSEYALLSIEFPSWEPLKAQVADPQRVDDYRRQCLSFIEDRLLSAPADVKLTKNGVLFVSFRQEESLEASILKAADEASQLLDEEFRFYDQRIQPRMGLDLEIETSKNPMTSTTERSLAPFGSLVVSERVYPYLVNHYKAEPIRLEDSAEQTAIQAFRLVRPATSTLNDFEEVADAGDSFLNDEEEALPEAVPDVTGQETGGETSSQEPVAPEPVHYDAPLLGLLKTSRPDNLNYQGAIEALSSEINAFLAPGFKNKGRIVSLCAHDGLGKSHIWDLVREQIDPNAQKALWLSAQNYRCFGPHELPLFGWMDLLQKPLGLTWEGQPPREVKEQVAQLLMRLFDGELPDEYMAFLSDFMLINPPQPLSIEQRDWVGRVETFFFKFLRYMASKKPLILVLEDLTYADTPSLELLTRLLEAGLLESQICLVLTHNRDFYASGRLAEVLQKSTHKELVVSNLDELEAERFLDDGPLGGRLQEFPVAFIELLLRRAQGSFLYMEEALRYLHLEQVLPFDTDTNKFLPPEETLPEDLVLPDDPRHLIGLRLKHLSDQTLYVLQLASVLGERFPIGLLMALSQMEDEEFRQAIEVLSAHGYFEPEPSSTGRFRHGLIWQAVYDYIDPEIRQQMHQLISETLDADFKQHFTTHPALVAYHAETGGLLNRAVNYWNLTGIYAGRIGALTAMNMAMFGSLRLLEHTSLEPSQAYQLMVRTYENLGIFNLDENPELAIQLLDAVLKYQQNKPESDAKQVELLGFLASAFEAKGDYTQALNLQEKVLALIDPKTNPWEAAALLIKKIDYLYTLGRLESAREIMESQIEPMARRPGREQNPDFFDSYLSALLVKAQILLAQCDSQVFKVVEEALGYARDWNMERLSIALQLVQGQAFLRSGQYESCNREAEGLLSAIESLENSDWFLAQWGLLAMMYHGELHDWESASHLILTVVSKSDESHDYVTWINAQSYAGYVTCKLGNYPEGHRILEQAVELASEYKFAGCALLGWRLLAEVELEQGHRDVAYQIASRALEISKKPEIQNRYEMIHLTLLCARCMSQSGDIKGAGKLLEPVWPQVVKSRFQPLIAACAFEIGQLYKNMAKDAPADLSRKHLMRSVEFFLKAKGIYLELRNLPQVKAVDAIIPKL